MQNRTRITALYIGGFLLGGLLHFLDSLLNELLKTLPGAEGSALPGLGSTALFVLNLTVYCLMLLWWMQSVHTRLLPSRGRVCTLSAGVLMLAFLLIRSVKYRLATLGSLLEHTCWYAYYVPLVLIPALFLMTCLDMEPERKNRPMLFRLVLCLALGVVLCIVTNDLHRWMFRPLGDVTATGGWGSYLVGPLWYICYGFIILCILLGLVVLALANRRRHGGRKAMLPALLLLGMLGMLQVVDRHVLTNNAPWQFPETAVFCMLGIFESSIHSRLIPYNENYVEFFTQTLLSAEITDPSLHTVYATQTPIYASETQRRQALDAPLLLDADTRLFGKKISAGYAFWTGDGSTLRRLNEELADANDVLKTENELLRYETEQAAKRLHVDARNQVYAKAAAEVYGCQKKIAALLDRLHPGSPEYPAVLANILLLNAYVKRKTNLVLQAAERDSVSAQELFLALDESAHFLSLCGVRSSAEQKTTREFPAAEATALYDSFELLAEFFVGKAVNLLALLTDESLRLVVECPLPQQLPPTPAVHTRTEEDGLLYLTLCAKGGGAA